MLVIVALATASPGCRRVEDDSAPSGDQALLPPVAGSPIHPDAGVRPASPARSPGCALPARAAARGESRARGGRTFHVWTPTSYESAKPYALVLAFHGWSSNGRDFQKWFLMEDHVRGEAIVVYPDAIGSAWDFRGDKELELFDSIVADIGGAYCLDPARTFAVGFSYGGRIVHHIGCHRSEALRGIAAGGSDWNIAERTACGRVPVIVTHRTHDGSMSFEGGRTSAAKWAGVNGCGPGDVVTDARLGCRAYAGCAAPVAFCADAHFDPSWPKAWNHTVREGYLDLTWRWLAALLVAL
jgi:poly(3-hydroxybutyrate) depolymerase